MDLPWQKLDVVTFSWQKVLGGEGAHGMLILSPRAVARLESYEPAWPMPKLFRLTKDKKLVEGIFEGETINTPSMLALEDYLDALKWAEAIGGLKGLIERANANLGALDQWVEKRAWVDFLCADPQTRSNTSVCLKIVDPWFTALVEGGAGRGRVEDRQPAREGGCRPRHRRLSRRAAGTAHLVRRHRRALRHREADALARLGVRAGEAELNPPSRPTAGPPRTGDVKSTENSMPKVLIADQLSPAAVAIFKERGVEADTKTGLVQGRAAEHHRRL